MKRSLLLGLALISFSAFAQSRGGYRDPNRPINRDPNSHSSVRAGWNYSGIDYRPGQYYRGSSNSGYQSSYGYSGGASLTPQYYEQRAHSYYRGSQGYYGAHTGHYYHGYQTPTQRAQK